MYKKKRKCGHCGNYYYWEETTEESGHSNCLKCKNNYGDKDDRMDDNDWENIKDKKGYDHDKWKEHKHDPNGWILELLSGKFDGRKVALFTEDGTHTIGTVDEVKKDFVTLISTEVPCAPANSGYFTYTKPVKVKNDDNDVLETFNKYFVRLDSIVGFGEPLEHDYGYPPCAGGGYPMVEDEDYMDEDYIDEE